MKPAQAYVAALLLLAAALGIRAALDPVVGERSPFLALVAATAAAVWVGGYRPALVVMVLGFFASTYLFIAPRGHLLIDAHQTVTSIAYLTTCVIVIAFGGAMRSAQAGFSMEADQLARLHQLSSHLWRSRDLQDGLDRILGAAIELMGADKGDLQLVDADRRTLLIVAHRGLSPGFLDFFKAVSVDDDSACGRALRSGQRTVIEDVERDPLFAPFRDVARDAGFRAVQSTPLLARDAQPIGILSTHWREPHRPDSQSLRRLDLYARQAVDFIERHRVEDALHASERQLRDADRRKDEFLALLAHELRNPLAPIRNGLTVLQTVESGGELAANAKTIMERQLAQMVRLIDDLVDVSRMTRGTLELRRERFDLSAAVEQVVSGIRPMVDRAEQRLTVQLPPERLQVDADPVRLSQALWNVLGNASKFSPRGGMITLTARREGSDLVFSIVDSGIGIPPDKLESVFELFSQIRSPVVEQQGGLGVGLTLVKRLVELHGGSIVARSGGTGQGSEFLIRLPIVVDSTLPSEPRMPEPIANTARRQRILVVDDNRDSAESLATLLQLGGHDAHVVFDGQEALAAAASYQPDVVLLDLGLPTIDGYEVCRRMRRESWGQQIPIIALTGWGHAEDMRRSRDAGFAAHLVKPVDPRVLMEVLEKAS